MPSNYLNRCFHFVNPQDQMPVVFNQILNIFFPSNPFENASCNLVAILLWPHWGRMTHICVSKVTVIGSDNGLSPGWRQAIIWTNAGLLSIGPLRTYFSENLIKIQQFSSKKMHMKMSSAKWRPSCLGLNVLTHWGRVTHICINKIYQHCFR